MNIEKKITSSDNDDSIENKTKRNLSLKSNASSSNLFSLKCTSNVKSGNKETNTKKAILAKYGQEEGYHEQSGEYSLSFKQKKNDETLSLVKAKGAKTVREVMTIKCNRKESDHEHSEEDSLSFVKQKKSTNKYDESVSLIKPCRIQLYRLPSDILCNKAVLKEYISKDKTEGKLYENLSKSKKRKAEATLVKVSSRKLENTEGESDISLHSIEISSKHSKNKYVASKRKVRNLSSCSNETSNSDSEEKAKKTKSSQKLSASNKSKREKSKRVNNRNKRHSRFQNSDNKLSETDSDIEESDARSRNSWVYKLKTSIQKKSKCRDKKLSSSDESGKQISESDSDSHVVLSSLKQRVLKKTSGKKVGLEKKYDETESNSDLDTNKPLIGRKKVQKKSKCRDKKLSSSDESGKQISESDSDSHVVLNSLKQRVGKKTSGKKAGLEKKYDETESNSDLDTNKQLIGRKKVKEKFSLRQKKSYRKDNEDKCNSDTDENEDLRKDLKERDSQKTKMKKNICDKGGDSEKILSEIEEKGEKKLENSGEINKNSSNVREREGTESKNSDGETDKSDTGQLSTNLLNMRKETGNERTVSTLDSSDSGESDSGSKNIQNNRIAFNQDQEIESSSYVSKRSDKENSDSEIAKSEKFNNSGVLDIENSKRIILKDKFESDDNSGASKGNDSGSTTYGVDEPEKDSVETETNLGFKIVKKRKFNELGDEEKELNNKEGFSEIEPSSKKMKELPSAKESAEELSGELKG